MYIALYMCTYVYILYMSIYIVGEIFQLGYVPKCP